MKSMSEARRVAHQLAAIYELDFDEVLEKVKDMGPEEFRSWKSDLQTKKTLNDE